MRSLSSIPKGLRNQAQGCEERAFAKRTACLLFWFTLGKVTDDSQPQRGCGMVLFPLSSATTLSGLSLIWGAFSHGSSFLATLGFVAQSLWDSAFGATHSRVSLARFICCFCLLLPFASNAQSLRLGTNEIVPGKI